MRRGKMPDMPPRPYLAPAVWGALGAVITARVAGYGGWLAFSSRSGGAQVPVLAYLALAIVPLVALGLRAGGLVVGRCLGANAAGLRARALTGWLTISCTAVALSCGAHALGACRDRAWVLAEPVSARTLRLVSDPTETAWAWRADAIMRDDAGRTARVEVESSYALERGDVLKVVGRVSPLDDDAWGERAYAAGSVATVRIVRVRERVRGGGGLAGNLRARVLEAIQPAQGTERALVAGIVCGRVTELNADPVSDAFARTGTSHLVAVSGSHLAFVSTLVVLAVRRTRMSRRGRSLLVLGVMGGYVLFTGAAASAVRSFIMVACAEFASLAERRPHPLSGLALAVMGMSVIEPGVVLDLGFQLSAASVLYIHLFFAYGERQLMRLGLPRAIASGLAMTLVAQWATLPIALPIFQELSLIAPVANLVLGPLMSALLVTGLVGSLIALAAPLASLGLAVPCALARVSIFLAELLARVPGASLALDAGRAEPALAALPVLALVVFVAWRDLPPRATRRVLAGMVALACAGTAYWSWCAPAQIVVLDVGQGDAILIRDGAARVLVDCGVDDAVVRALARQHVLSLDRVVVTHWDSDHWGGLPAVLDAMDVGGITVAQGAAATMPEELEAHGPPPVHELHAGDAFSVGRFSCRVIWPREPVEGAENEESLVLDVRFAAGDAHLRVLLTGDTEASELERYASAVGKVDVLKLGHHGSAESVSAQALATLDPAVAVASAGEHNRYGHPAPKAQELVREAGARFVCTMTSGDVAFTPGADAFAMTEGHPTG